MNHNRLPLILIMSVILSLSVTACEYSHSVEPLPMSVKISTNSVQNEPSDVPPEPDHSQQSQSTIPRPPAAYHLDAPIISQLPELYNGCEVTSLAMLTAFLGLPFTKEELADLIPKDLTEPRFDEQGAIIAWGDPREGFVGDISGIDIGYSVNNEPLEKLLNQVYPPGSLNLSGSSFKEVEKAITEGKPVVAWTTEDFQPTEQWVTWETPSGGTFKGTFSVHAVLITGFDEQCVYVNNPLTGEKDQQVEKAAFLEAWEQLGRQALTYR